jgi:hypothetical protein
MMDLLFLAATLGFFASCGALIRLAERLMPGPPPGTPPGVGTTAAVKNGHDRPDAR